MSNIGHVPQNFRSLIYTLILAARGWEIEKLEPIKHLPKVISSNVCPLYTQSAMASQIAVMRQVKGSYSLIQRERVHSHCHYLYG